MELTSFTHLCKKKNPDLQGTEIISNNISSTKTWLF